MRPDLTLSSHTHRTIQDNILVDNNGNPVLCDMGFTTNSQTAVIFRVPTTEFFGCTFQWTAPEILEKLEMDSNDVIVPSRKGDIFSFGMTMYEILSGYPPFYFYNYNKTGLGSFRTRSIIDGVRPSSAHIRVGGSLWELMSNCWHATADSRPCIGDIVARLKEIEGVTS